MLVLGLVVAGIVAALVWRGEKEPEYQGKKLSEWIDLCSAWKGDVDLQRQHREATDAVRRIGTNAIPYLLKWIRYETPDWRDKLESAIQKLPSAISDSSAVESLTKDKADARAEAAAEALDILGPDASAAVPNLSKLLNDPKRPE